MTISTLTSINPDRSAPPGGHYSHGTVANGFVFVSGQLPITPAGDRLTEASFSVQTRQVLANVEAGALRKRQQRFETCAGSGLHRQS